MHPSVGLRFTLIIGLCFAFSPIAKACCNQPPPAGCLLPSVWSTTYCACYVPPGSPIIIDTSGAGFHLTSPRDGVMFDIGGDGQPIQVAWTAPGSANAFLALDRNGDGKIDSGTELFGNYTQQPSSPNPNGFVALAQFDKPENGGNGDGIINSSDAVYSSLLLWIDENHDGVSQPSDLHTLPELGTYSLSLDYQAYQRVDQFGNQFRYRSAVNQSLPGRGFEGWPLGSRRFLRGVRWLWQHR